MQGAPYIGALGWVHAGDEDCGLVLLHVGDGCEHQNVSCLNARAAARPYHAVADLQAGDPGADAFNDAEIANIGLKVIACGASKSTRFLRSQLVL
jgi:hypothetical protein